MAIMVTPCDQPIRLLQEVRRLVWVLVQVVQVHSVGPKLA